MCKVEMLRVLVKQRLTAAVEEIFVVLERTIAEYEEELSRTKEENERQRQLLDALFNKHQQTDVRQKPISPEQKEWSSSMEEGEPQPPNIKEEEEEHLEGLKEFPVIVKSEDEDDEEEQREAERPGSSSTQHMTREGDGGASQADLAPLSDSENTTSADTDDEAAQTRHADNTHLKCSHCDKTFGKKRNLTRHMRRHTDNRCWKCSQCGKTFSKKGNLTVHTRIIHAGEKPFRCAICGKQFSTKSNMTTHTRTHSGGADDARFRCSQCDKTFIAKAFLIRHTRSHTGEKPFACSVCDKRFTRHDYMKRHRVMHTGEKPYCCSICGRGFYVSSALLKHTRTHTGEKVLSCSV
ncbi:uncharacterized protein [Nerophis lumbriciformis]|uniref:uncharacterized protein n=1 Tax=Nerophis lumbriciformis TaxID=546530 RepID=UPI002AE093B7|nr:zinc finger protein OZF-like isoform X3 [Nerophis lumbriciformis]